MSEQASARNANESKAAPHLQSVEPATGAILWEGNAGNPASACSRAAAAWQGWAALDLVVRVEKLRGFLNRLRAERDPICDLLARETGRIVWDCHEEFDQMADLFDGAIQAHRERAAQRRLEGGSGVDVKLQHRSHGVMVVITPFATPLLTGMSPIFQALVAGNCVVWKASERTPATIEAVGKIFRQSGIDDAVLQVIQGDGTTGRELVSNPHVSGIFFTGSAQTGIAINRQLANRPDKMLALHLGGNNPIIAWDTGDLHAAATLIVKSAFMSAGQRCTSARRLIVANAIAKPLLAEVQQITKRLIIGEPFDDPFPFMGAMIDEDMADGLTGSFLALMSAGGKPLMHMKRPIADRPFVSPGIIDVTDLTERPDIELFGPLLQVVRVATFEEAIAEANATRYGLAASLIGGIEEHFTSFRNLSRAGIIHWNRTTHDIVPHAPYAGQGLSGNNRPGGAYAADQCVYPMFSSAADKPRGIIGIGLAPANESKAEAA